jgi:16S rRNA (cytidine1402-2'-O)-methyltransferase
VKTRSEQGGTLYLCGTPIGNLKDVSKRLLDVLEKVEAVVCEDTRRTRKLLSYYGLGKRVISLYRHVERERSGIILNILSQGGSCALVSDAGMPLISDPGAYLVRQAKEKGYKVVVVPGPSSVTAAVALAGYPGDQFIFGGFLPRKSKQRKEYFIEWIKPGVPCVFFESPHRLVKAMKDLEQVFPYIDVCLCHEMTKIHESVFEGPVSQVIEKLEDQPVRGEWVIVVYLDTQ